jgi:hypothetical protein
MRSDRTFRRRNIRSLSGVSLLLALLVLGVK